MRRVFFILFPLPLFILFSLPARGIGDENFVSPSAEVKELETPLKSESVKNPDITQKNEEVKESLEAILESQELGPLFPFNPLKYAIRSAVRAGVPANTIVLLLLLPLVASIIAAGRHIVGLRGFGIFVPASLSIVFLSTGPVLGIFLFLAIVFVSFVFRWIMKKLKIRLQYLPRMALILWAVSFGMLGILFLAPLFGSLGITNVSIFPILFLILLAEDFSRVQTGKSIKTAINLTTESLALALVSFFILSLKEIQSFVLLNPELSLSLIFVFDFLMGRYVGLRLLEVWRFRKLIFG